MSKDRAHGQRAYGRQSKTAGTVGRLATWPLGAHLDSTRKLVAGEAGRAVRGDLVVPVGRLRVNVIDLLHARRCVHSSLPDRVHVVEVDLLELFQLRGLLTVEVVAPLEPLLLFESSNVKRREPERPLVRLAKEGKPARTDVAGDVVAHVIAALQVGTIAFSPRGCRRGGRREP